MAILMADGFDFYTVIGDAAAQQGSGNLVWDAVSSVAGLTSTTRFSVGQAFATTNNAVGQLQKSYGSNEATVFICCAQYFTAVSLGSSGDGFGWQLFDGTTAQCTIWFENDGAIRLRAGSSNSGTILATFTGAFAAQTWNQFQIEATVNSTTGAIHIRKNGNTSDDFSATGLNTQASGNAYSNLIKLTTSGSSTQNFLDDVLIFSSSGSAPNTWVGDVRAIQMMAASDPATIDFSPFPTTYGYNSNSDGGNTDSELANTIYWTAVTSGRDGKITSASVTLASGFTGHMIAGIYSSGGTNGPNSLLGTSTAVTNPVTGLNVFNFSTPVSVSNGGTYYVAILADAAFSIKDSTTLDATAVPTTTGANPYASGFTVTNPNPVNTIRTFKLGFTITPANHEQINELKEDGDTTYIFDSTVGDEDLYGVSAMSSTPASIVGVIAKMFCRKDATGGRSIALQFKSGTTEVNGTTAVMNTGYGWLTQTQMQDPNTSAPWTETGVNNALLGPKIIA